MKIVVVFKWSRNPQDARVGTEGSLEWRGVKMAASDDDPAAILAAGEIAAAGDEIVGLTIGDGDTAWAAARGAARTVVVSDATVVPNGAATGAILAAAVRGMADVGLVLIGDSVWDYGVVAALAGQLGWPALTGVTAVRRQAGNWLATRRHGNVSQEIAITGPALLAMVASRAEQRAPSMKDVLAARKKPVTALTTEDLNIVTATTVTPLATALPDVSAARIIDGADPRQAAEELLNALRTQGVL
ncbi:electron transfer flavoprotein subunit alpha [Martelella alba]|uniref:Electron transfer flavoprotein subunit alpha n=1 Tax=Martelella alba TaxID=2590451 RepID=A0ABY2SG93_9HYPH|nr:electron transfer flavoprotein subunit alpha [Martelella alba]TKI04102.1 electron transfer flavoprotein subunit alpha [Martelella alba]